MAYELHSYIVDPDGSIKVEHIFYGYTRAECEGYRDEHLAGCGYFSGAHTDGRVDEEWVEIDEDDLPAADEDDEDEPDER